MKRRDLLKAGVAASVGGVVACARGSAGAGGTPGAAGAAPGSSDGAARGVRAAPRDIPRPTPQQLAWQTSAMGMFLHFGVNTYSDREWGLGNESPRSFNPVNLDARQWTRAAKAAGCQYVVLTAKHHDGFCLWPSRVTPHSVQSSPWRRGNGDVVRELADAARADGLGLGLYLSPWDRNAPSYGSGDVYNDFYIAQLEELLTRYGPLVEVWFDGANGEGPNGKRQKYDWPRIHRTVRELQPNALMFSDSGPDIRWIGNERGVAGDPNWSAVDPSIVTEPGMDGPHIIAALQHGNAPPAGTVWRPGEAPVSIRPGWFHHPAEDDKVKSPEALMELWFNCVGRNANLLLNVPPARDGLLSAADVRALEGFGAAQREYWAGGPELTTRQRGLTLSVSIPRATKVRAVMLAEHIADGQTIARYRVEGETAAGWSVLSRGTTIGRRKVDRFEPVEVRAIRVAIEESFGTPRFDVARLAPG